MNSTASTAKTVLITGSARRIGAFFARTLHSQNYNIVIHYRNAQKEALSLAETLNKNRKNSAITFQANLSHFFSYQNLVDATIKYFGRLDVLVNNASSFYPTKIGEISEKHWDDLLSSNLKAPLFLSQAATPILKKNKGCIINMIDIHALKPLKGYPVYSTAKSGLYTLTQALAKELAPEIRVNGISPGSIMWPEGDSELTPKQKNKVINNIALKRQGKPEDLANALSFLINKKSNYITGQIITIDGGRSLV